MPYELDLAVRAEHVLNDLPAAGRQAPWWDSGVRRGLGWLTEEGAVTCGTADPPCRLSLLGVAPHERVNQPKALLTASRPVGSPKCCAG